MANVTISGGWNLDSVGPNSLSGLYISFMEPNRFGGGLGSTYAFTGSGFTYSSDEPGYDKAVLSGVMTGYSASAGGTSVSGPPRSISISGFSIPVVDFIAGQSGYAAMLAGHDTIGLSTGEFGFTAPVANGYGGDDIFTVTLAGGLSQKTARIIGGDGADTVILPGHSATWAVATWSGGVELTKGNTEILLTEIEQVSFDDRTVSVAALVSGPTDGDDDIVYGDSGNVVFALGGDDRIRVGGGDDTVYLGDGNDYADGVNGNDVLFGEAGKDTLVGGAGDDLLFGGASADSMAGGAGFDTAAYDDAPSGVGVSLFAGRGFMGEADGDVLVGIEALRGSAHADMLSGSVVSGGGGNDHIAGGSSADSLFGNAGDDAVFGAGGDDVLTGGEGVDVLSGEAGNDALHGGDDTDYLFGGEGDDLLFGDGGDDVMTGGSGNDFFVLGEGDDAIFTGAGADVIRFDYGNGRDTVFDFEIGVDRIDFTHTDMRPDVVAANAWDVPDGVFLSLGSGSILLSGVTLADIDFWTDFTYA